MLKRWKQRKPEEDNEDDIYGSLPAEIWVHIFSFMTPNTLAQVRGVCKLWDGMLMGDPSLSEKIRQAIEDGNAKMKERKEEEERRKEQQQSGCDYECCKVVFGMPAAGCCPWPFFCWFIKDRSEKDVLGHAIACVMCAAVPCCCPCYTCVGWGVLLFA